MRSRRALRVLLRLFVVAALGACSAQGAVEQEDRPLPPRRAPPLTDSGLGVARPETPPEVRAPPAPGGAVQALLGSAAGVPITMDELVLAWHEVSSREVWLVVEKLVATRFAFAEAGRLGFELDPAIVDAAVAQRRAELEAEAEKEQGSPSLEEYLARHFNMGSAVYFERMRSAALRQAVAERAIRAWTLENPTREVRIVTIEREEEMRAVEAAARSGEDFAELARKHSSDETAQQGGLVPYVVRQELSPLARLAFDTPVGEIGGPLWVGGHGFLVRVEEERNASSGEGAALREEVEASLFEHPVSDAEFIHWKIQMEKSYPIDLEPLKRLLGATEAGS